LFSLLFCGIGAALAYLYISSLRPAGSSPPFAIDLDLAQLLLEGRLIVFYQSVLILACLVNFKFFVNEWKNGEVFPFLLIGSVLAIDLATLGIRFLDHTDYKLWVFAAIFLGLLAAPALASTTKLFPVWTTTMLTVLFLPLSRSIWEDSLGLRKINPPMEITSEKGQLKIADKNLQEPYTWISENTPIDSVLIEQDFAWAPIFANRSIFICNHRGGTKIQLFGFLTPINLWLSEFCGFGDDFVDKRIGLISNLFSDYPSDKCIEIILNEVKNRSVFILDRSSGAEVSFNSNKFGSRIVRVACGDAWKLYKIEPASH